MNLPPLRWLRLVALCEGISLLVLVFVAMPLKYGLGMPMAVRIIGLLHGLLFLVFLSALFRVAIERQWPLRRSIGALVAAIVPFGVFVLDKQLRREPEAPT